MLKQSHNYNESPLLCFMCTHRTPLSCPGRLFWQYCAESRSRPWREACARWECSTMLWPCWCHWLWAGWRRWRGMRMLCLENQTDVGDTGPCNSSCGSPQVQLSTHPTGCPWTWCKSLFCSRLLPVRHNARIASWLSAWCGRHVDVPEPPGKAGWTCQQSHPESKDSSRLLHNWPRTAAAVRLHPRKSALSGWWGTCASCFPELPASFLSPGCGWSLTFLRLQRGRPGQEDGSSGGGPERSGRRSTGTTGGPGCSCLVPAETER